MNRRDFLTALGAGTLGLGCARTGWAAPGEQRRPNVVWVLSEDNSKHYLRLFDPAGAPAPAIESMADAGIAFVHAFSNAPVCSVARTTLMSSMYGPRVGHQYHRKMKPANLPGDLRLFPYYLRQAGYYTSNNRKKDYNVVEGDGVWDESSGKATWRRRPSPETPFFHMISTAVSHEGRLHFTPENMAKQRPATDPANVAVAPYHPRTATFRYTYARYHDCMTAVDRIVKGVLDDLREDGLLEDTFVFYFGDHGGVLPGSKGYIRDAGLHVPLVVRVPANFRHLCTIPRGSRVTGFVSFIDFGPTVLTLAGVPVPGVVDGRPFLGPAVTPEQIEKRQETFSYADRFDEKYDLCRALRRGRFKYVRNYQAFYPDGLQNNYRYRMLAYQEWRDLYRNGRLSPVQAAFFEPKPVEALYDVVADPHEVHNLADDPAHAPRLADMRARLRAHVKALPDLSFFPESELIERALGDGVGFGQKHRNEIARLVDIADLSLLPFDEASPGLRDALASARPWERYWGLIACSCFAAAASSMEAAGRSLLEDPVPLVRARAAEFLAILGAEDPRPTLVSVLNASTSEAEALLVLNTVVYINDHLNGYPFDVRQLNLTVKGSEVARRIMYLNEVAAG